MGDRSRVSFGHAGVTLQSALRYHYRACGHHYAATGLLQEPRRGRNKTQWTPCRAEQMRRHGAARRVDLLTCQAAHGVNPGGGGGEEEGGGAQGGAQEGTQGALVLRTTVKHKKNADNIFRLGTMAPRQQQAHNLSRVVGDLPPPLA